MSDRSTNGTDVSRNAHFVIQDDVIQENAIRGDKKQYDVRSDIFDYQDNERKSPLRALSNGQVFTTYLLNNKNESIRAVAVRHGVGPGKRWRNNNYLNVRCRTQHLVTLLSEVDLDKLEQRETYIDVAMIPLFTAGEPSVVKSRFRLISCRNGSESSNCTLTLVQNSNSMDKPVESIFDINKYTMTEPVWNQLLRMEKQLEIKVGARSCRTIMFVGTSKMDRADKVAWWFGAGVSRLDSRRVLYVPLSNSNQEEVRNSDGSKSLVQLSPENIPADIDVRYFPRQHLEKMMLKMPAETVLSAILDLGHKQFSHVIFSAPSLPNDPVAELLSDMVDGVYVVARQGVTQRKSILQCMRTLETKKALYLGAVYNENKVR